MNNTPSKIAASAVLMVVFLIDALLYIWTSVTDIWGFVTLASVYVVSLLIAAGIVSIINK